MRYSESDVHYRSVRASSSPFSGSLGFSGWACRGWPKTKKKLRAKTTLIERFREVKPRFRHRSLFEGCPRASSLVFFCRFSSVLNIFGASAPHRRYFLAFFALLWASPGPPKNEKTKGCKIWARTQKTLCLQPERVPAHKKKTQCQLREREGGYQLFGEEEGGGERGGFQIGWLLFPTCVFSVYPCSNCFF